jgi:hypothetical protein
MRRGRCVTPRRSVVPTIIIYFLLVQELYISQITAKGSATSCNLERAATARAATASATTSAASHDDGSDGSDGSDGKDFLVPCKLKRHCETLAHGVSTLFV